MVVIHLHSIFNPGNLGNAGTLAGMLECQECQNVVPGMCRKYDEQIISPKMNSGGTPYTHISLQAAIYFQYIKFGFIYKYLINIIGIMIIDEYEIIK